MSSETRLKKVGCHRCKLYYAKKICASCNKPLCLNCSFNLVLTFDGKHILKWKVCKECYTLRKHESVKCNLQPEVYYLEKA